MALYVVERSLPGVTSEQLVAAAGRAKSTAAAMSSPGAPVRYVRSTFIPGEARCFCLFEAPTARIVEQVNERAGIPFERVVEALAVVAEELG